MPAVGDACSGQLEPSGSAWHRSDLQPSTSASLDWSGALPNQPPGIYGGSSCRDAALPAGWCADRFGGAMTAVAGCTKNLSHSAVGCVERKRNPSSGGLREAMGFAFALPILLLRCLLFRQQRLAN